MMPNSLKYIALLLSAAAAGVVDSGTCGTNLTWTLYEDGELVIDGAGTMKDYSKFGYNNSAPWYKYSNINTVTIGDAVTSIGSYAFNYCDLTSVSIGNNVSSIGEWAFYGCDALTSVVIPEGVTDIEKAAFFGCTALTSVVIGENVTSVSSSVFENCTALTSVTIPSSLTYIGDGAFWKCTIKCLYLRWNPPMQIFRSSFRITV